MAGAGTGLLSLPLELLERIFHNLDSIEDVHHFARMSKKTYDVIRLPSAYTDIMRDVIGSSSQHRFDIVLCDLLNIHRRIVARFADHNNHNQLHLAARADQLEPGSIEAQLLTAVTDQCEFGTCNKCLPDDRVHEILARYQGLRVLEDLWLMRPLSTDDLVAVEQTVDQHELAHAHQTLLKQYENFKDGVSTVAPHQSIVATSYTSFNPDQRGRFHAALISTWALNEIRWIFTQFASQINQPVSMVQLKLLESCKTLFEKHKTDKPIVDEADRCAIWQFLYSHMLPLYGSFLADQNCSKLPLTFPSNFGTSQHKTRMFQLFMLAGQTYLQPPDLTDLAIRYQVSKKRPYPELKIPSSTEMYQRPSREFRFRSGTNYDMGIPNREQQAIAHLNVISYTTINQSVVSPFTRWVAQTPSGLFPAIDESGAYFREAIVAKFIIGVQCDIQHDIRRQIASGDMKLKCQENWAQVWWEVWWWANGEDKARAKIERWLRK